MKKGTTQIGFGVLFFLLAAWCFNWICSIEGISFQYCTGSYAAHTEYRCKEPFFAFMLFVICGGFSYALLAGGIKRMKRVNKVIKRQKASTRRLKEI
jgi:amino acid transporter